jgi:glutamate synthase domain-containing protein 3
MEALEPDELLWLGEVISSHAKLTGSRVAAALLADWPIAAVRFSRVMPRDYRRVLSVRAEAAALGVDADKMIMEASRG